LTDGFSADGTYPLASVECALMSLSVPVSIK